MAGFSESRLAQLAKAEQDAQAKTDSDRRRLWHWLKAKDPDLCAHILLMQEKFDGKVVSIETPARRLLCLPEASTLRLDQHLQALRVARLEAELRECLERYDGYRWVEGERLKAKQGPKSFDDDAQTG